MLFAATLASPAAAQLDSEPEHLLAQRQLDFQRSEGLDDYVLLLQMWGQWENTDPRKVEEALRLAAEDTRKSPQARAYAQELAGYARLRRGDLHAAARAFEDLGFITEWLVVGPFDNEGKAGFSTQFGPEAEQGVPIVPGRAYSGKERPVRWRSLPRVFHYGWVDLGAVFRPETHICGYATSFVNPGDARRRVVVWAGSQGALRVAVNGQVAIEDDAYRGFDDDRLSATVDLEPGWNRLTVKVCSNQGSPLFSLRLSDSSGVPLTESLQVSADVATSEEAAATVQAVAKADAARSQNQRALPKHPLRLRGPLELVKEIADDERATAQDLEGAVRYLQLTSGEDEAAHLARDLAKRAVEREPTIDRYLLAARLAEDRNAGRRFIESAEKLAEKLGESHDTDLLLAKAAHLRSGPNPRDAFALYDQVLAREPLQLEALQGRVELYNAAGLKRTALAALEDAYRLRPHSVLLANMVATQKAALGYASEAANVEERYAALRFDDTSFLTGRMELALARRNHRAAGHWLQRLLDSEPESLWSYRVAARVHRQMGQHERAIADLELARSIAPEDIGVLRHLADLRGRAGEREEQLALLREVLRLRPQEVEVRKYVEHIEPPEAPADEVYAMPSDEFLKWRHRDAKGHPRRTLRDLTVSTVYPNGLSSQYRQVVFQPLTDAAAASSRQYAFQYQADRQRVQLKGARIFRVDGSVDEAIESGEAAADDPSVSMYTSARTYYVQFPRLEPGDVVELRYRIDDVTPRNEFADYYGDIVYLQSDEPVFSAEYVLVTPKSRKLYVDAQVPNLQKKVVTKDDQRIYRFWANDVPAIQPEANMPPWPEILGFVHVSTYESWNQLGRWYWGLVKDQLDLDAETKELAQEIAKGKTTDIEKVKAVYNWVIKNTRYVALEFGIYGYKPRRCVQTVARGWGDCKDKATVIVTLLRELGVDAQLVIVRTGHRGDFPSKLPSLAPFDHAIAYVPSMDLYLDGTAEHTGTFELPVMDQEALGLLVQDGKAELVRLPKPDPEDNLIERKLVVDLAKDGSAELDIDYLVKGNAAPGFRARYEAQATRKERLSSDLGGEFPGLDIDVVETSDLNDVEQLVTLDIDGQVERFARQEGSALSLPVTLGTRLTPRYAALSERKRDLRIVGFSTRSETVVVELPAGMTVDSLPPESSGESRFGRWKLTVEQKGNRVTVHSELALFVTRISPEDYSEFRQFAVQVDRAMAHRLLLKP